MEVLDDCLLKRELIVHITLDKYRNELQFSDNRRAPTTLAGDEFVVIWLTLHWADNEGLQYAKFTD